MNFFSVRPERPADASSVEVLVSSVFGPGMQARAAYALREGIDHELDLSFVAESDDSLVGYVRQTRILVGDDLGLLLGPLAVLSVHKGRGIGRDLMTHAVDAARATATKSVATQKFVLLVGDLDYYQPFGFECVPNGSIIMPRPVALDRILVCSLDDSASPPTGIARAPSQKSS